MRGRRWKWLPPDVRKQVIRLAAKGRTYQEIVEELDLSLGVVWRVLAPMGGMIRPEQYPTSSTRLSLEDRIEIRLGIEQGWSYARIGATIGRSPSTVCREVNANGRRAGYRPAAAHRRAWQQARRPKVTKLTANRTLCERVVDDLEHLWSPMQITRRLRRDFGDDATMHLSHETIYRSLYVQGRGELRRELARCLRTGRAKRRSQGRAKQLGRIADMVMISERPAEVDDRAVPGHWEGDLIIGKDNKSAIGTLVERTTRFVMLLHLSDQTAATVRDAMVKAIATLPEALRRSITWDQGSELAEHRRFTVESGVQIYFCDPRSPWQRGSNENTNGLLRQYFPKGTDLSVHGPDVLQAAADSLNGRPRQTLDWMTPSEKLTEVIAMTA